MYFTKPAHRNFLKSFLCPTLRKSGAHIGFGLSVCILVCVCMGYGDIGLKLPVWIPHGKIADAYFWFSLNYLPLLNYGPLTNKGMKFLNAVSRKVF